MELLFDFEKVASQASRLEELALALEQEGKGNLSDALDEVAGAWSGSASEEYLKRAGRFRGNVVATARDLAHTASVIRTVAKALYDAEMEAQHIATERRYGG